MNNVFAPWKIDVLILPNYYKKKKYTELLDGLGKCKENPKYVTVYWPLCAHHVDV